MGYFEKLVKIIRQYLRFISCRRKMPFQNGILQQIVNKKSKLLPLYYFVLIISFVKDSSKQLSCPSNFFVPETKLIILLGYYGVRKLHDHYTYFNDNF